MGGCASTDAAPAGAASTPTSPTAIALVVPHYYTAAMVHTHSTRASLWCVIRGRVYDLTPFLSRHPGGVNALLLNCDGQDATEAFVDQHEDSKRANQTLETLCIGELMPDGDARAGQPIVPNSAAVAPAAAPVTSAASGSASTPPRLSIRSRP